MLGWSSAAAASASIRNRCRSASDARCAGPDHLQGDSASQRHLPGAKDDAHPATPQFVDDLVAGNFLDARVSAIEHARQSLRHFALEHGRLGRPGRGEHVVDERGIVREPGKVFLSCGHFAPPAPDLQLDREQLVQERRPVDGGNLVKELLDPGPRSINPGRLEAVARIVNSDDPRANRCTARGWARQRPVVGHSSSPVHASRINSSLPRRCAGYSRAA